MRKILFFILIILIIFPSFIVYSKEDRVGDIAYKHIVELGRIGNRAVTTESEKNAKKYILEQLKYFGYNPKVLKFKVEGYTTANIEVFKKGEDSSKTIIIGAHYDGRIEGNGFDDNGSGISVLLELCKIIKNQVTPYNIKFVFFAAEEINILGRGLHGSYDYVENLSRREKSKILYMINLDTLISGDNMYVYNSYKDENNFNSLSDELLNKIKLISERLDIDLNFNYDEKNKVSFTNTKSDYYPFYDLGIPILYFESTNWNAGNEDGRSQSEFLGRSIHSSMDNMIFIENIFKGRIEDRLRDYVRIIYKMVTGRLI